MNKASNTSIFIAYSRKDKDYLNELRSHLRALERRKLVQKIWYDGEIIVGEKWEAAIERNLNAAKVILLLISSDFIASDYCHSKELQQALERHEAGEAIVIPVIVRDCYWEDEEFAALQIPNEGKAIASFPSQKDTFYANVVRAIRRALKNQNAASETKPKTITATPTPIKKKSIYTPPTEIRSPKQESRLPFEPEMVFVKGGVFTMGWLEGRDGNKIESATPAHRVHLDDFWIGKYPVTNEEFCVFLNDYRSDKVKGGEHKGQAMIDEHQWGVQASGRWRPAKGFERHPIIKVSWYGANEYAKWLSEKTGETYALPSEAQWEYAARGGWEIQNFLYSRSNQLEEVGWYQGNSKGQTQAVGQKKANELGIHDMSGNVWEWCADYWNENYKDAPDNGTPWLKGDASRVLRGGSWGLNDSFCRVSYRFRNYAYNRSIYIGFRFAGLTNP